MSIKKASCNICVVINCSLKANKSMQADLPDLAMAEYWTALFTPAREHTHTHKHTHTHTHTRMSTHTHTHTHTRIHTHTHEHTHTHTHTHTRMSTQTHTHTHTHIHTQQQSKFVQQREIQHERALCTLISLRLSENARNPAQL